MSIINIIQRREKEFSKKYQLKCWWGKQCDKGKTCEIEVYNRTNKSFNRQTIIEILEEEIEWMKNQYEDERPVDILAGEPVETYGYEATHNQALKKVIIHLQEQLEALKKLQ